MLTATSRVVSVVVIFAIAALFRLNGDISLLVTADHIARYIDEYMTDPRHRGFALDVGAAGKRQNPHMHLLEAYLFLHRVAPGRGFLDRAARLVELFDARLLDHDRQIIPENFGEDWSRSAVEPTHHRWEPGHHFEWAWLLDNFARATGLQAMPAIQGIADNARAYGISESGLIFAELDATMKVTKSSHRLWPHCEALKATTFTIQNETRAANQAACWIRLMFDHFLDRPFEGGWIDHLDGDGRPLVDYVPASSLYHLMLAASEADAALESVFRPASANSIAEARP